MLYIFCFLIVVNGVYKLFAERDGDENSVERSGTDGPVSGDSF